jgi:hypothetical protein
MSRINKQFRPRVGNRATLNDYGSFPGLSRYLLKQLKYIDFAEQVSAGVSVYTYRLNSLYDPDETGTGSQPYGFDELMTLYTYYRVESVDIEVEATNIGGNAALVAVAPSRLATDPTSVQDVAAMPHAKHALLPNIGDNKILFTFHVNIADLLGLVGNVDDNLIGTASTNPTRMCYMHCASTEYDASAKAIYWSVKINYNARFTNLKQLALS